MIQRITATVELHILFYQISKDFGFSEEDIQSHEESIFTLLELWEQQGYVEVYESVEERELGRIKDSSKAIGAVPWYLDLYHARLSKNNDPLLVLRRDSDISFTIRFLANHNQIFGEKADKYSKLAMDRIRKRIDDFIQLGN
ncbi:hypothetical protein A1D22_00775 [Pasteurellaceae bacterium LFhippo2]|nr:hypothetical protein [Pasteurellaceae bacterium LFhippo2]